MFRILILFLTIFLTFSCGEVSKSKSINKSKVLKENIKSDFLSVDKKIFIQKCNDYLIETKENNSYLLNYLCKQECGYSCLKAFRITDNQEFLKRSLFLLSNECKNGIATSCLILGDYYSKLNNKDKAIEYYSKGCDLNNSVSCYRLAYIDKKSSANHLLKACKLDYPKACFDLGALYYKKNDYMNAEKFLDKSCNLKYTKGCYLLAKIYLKDSKNIDKALNYLDKSCKLDIENACLYIGYVYYSGKGVKKDKNKALEYFKYACDKLNSGKGCSLSGIIFYGKKESINSICYLKKGCDLKDGSGCLSLSLLFMKGEIFNKNPNKALYYLNLAKDYGVRNDIMQYLCKAGLKEACSKKKR